MLSGASSASRSHVQICWKWTKVVTDAPLRNGGGFRAFLDGSQYKLTGILRYERIFGPGFVSTGGIGTTKARGRAQLQTCPDLDSFLCMHMHGGRLRRLHCAHERRPGVSWKGWSTLRHACWIAVFCPEASLGLLRRSLWGCWI